MTNTKMEQLVKNTLSVTDLNTFSQLKISVNEEGVKLHNPKLGILELSPTDWLSINKWVLNQIQTKK